MKHISLIILMLAMNLGFSRFAFSADLFSYNISNCEFWTPAPTSSGYLCANWPFSYQTLKVMEKPLIL
jgi:hypothetical protein